MAAVESIAENGICCPCCGQAVTDVKFLCDASTYTITNGAYTLRMTPRQFQLAQFLISRYPAAVNKNDIYDNVFVDARGEGPDMKIIDVFVCQIRPILAEIGLVIETVWGMGYKIVEADATMANSIKEASVRARLPGSKHRWLPAHDAQALELLRRKLNTTAIASIMRLPYMTVERNVRRLQALV
jgi:DNA-binding winged helix-turn-helix (wHTH) protein